MSSLPVNTMLPLLKTAIIPIILISIFLRNRRQKRLRAEREAQAQEDRRTARRASFYPAETRPEILRDLLRRFDAGEPFSASDGVEVTRGLIANRLAAALLSEEAWEQAEPILSECLADAETGTPDNRRDALMLMARLRSVQNQPEQARGCLSEAADLHLARLRAEARGDILHFAERLAAGMTDTGKIPDLSDPKLTDYGPLVGLALAGRRAEAREIAADLVARVERAMAETADDPTGRVDGFPRDLLVRVRARLASFAALPD